MSRVRIFVIGGAVLGWLGLMAVALAAIATTPVTVTTTSAACLPQYTGLAVGQIPQLTTSILVKNEAVTDSIAIRIGYNSLPTAVLNTAGDITIPAGVLLLISDPNLGGSYLACIGAGTDPVTIMVN
jgi:hypothetical protein